MFLWILSIISCVEGCSSGLSFQIFCSRLTPTAANQNGHFRSWFRGVKLNLHWGLYFGKNLKNLRVCWVFPQVSMGTPPILKIVVWEKLLNTSMLSLLLQTPASNSMCNSSSFPPKEQYMCYSSDYIFNSSSFLDCLCIFIPFLSLSWLFQGCLGK